MSPDEGVNSCLLDDTETFRDIIILIVVLAAILCLVSLINKKLSGMFSNSQQYAILEIVGKNKSMENLISQNKKGE